MTTATNAERNTHRDRRHTCALRAGMLGAAIAFAVGHSGPANAQFSGGAGGGGVNFDTTGTSSTAPVDQESSGGKDQRDGTQQQSSTTSQASQTGQAGSTGGGVTGGSSQSATGTQGGSGTSSQSSQTGQSGSRTGQAGSQAGGGRQAREDGEDEPLEGLIKGIEAVQEGLEAFKDQGERTRASQEDLSRCGGRLVENAIGLQLVRAPATEGEIALANIPADARLIGPDDQVTMDMNPERLNVHLDRNNVIVDVTCG